MGLPKSRMPLTTIRQPDKRIREHVAVATCSLSEEAAREST